LSEGLKIVIRSTFLKNYNRKPDCNQVVIIVGLGVSLKN